MNVIYISYWGVNDGLTQSTVFPHLELLIHDSRITKIYFFTFERASFNFKNNSTKMVHVPIKESTFPPGVNKFLAFFKGWAEMKKVVKEIQFDLVFCRSVFAGILGYKCFKEFSIPYIVESYEPHAKYMEESGEWKKNGIKSKIYRKYDQLIRKTAIRLLPVSHNYYLKLLKEGIDIQRLNVVPCSVNIEKFKFNYDDRVFLRTQLNIPDHIKVGIYVGKFGGIYLKEEAFELFKEVLLSFDQEFYLIIITQENQEFIKNQLKMFDFPLNKVFINKVEHIEVPRFLSASDFAFSTIKPALSRIYCSPIKDGEYWANGLPVLITKGVGDDDAIISENEIGVVYDLAIEDSKIASKKMFDFMVIFDRTNYDHRKKIVDIAIKHRSFEINKKCYSELIENIFTA